MSKHLQPVHHRDWIGTDTILIMERSFFPTMDMIHMISNPSWLPQSMFYYTMAISTRKLVTFFNKYAAQN